MEAMEHNATPSNHLDPRAKTVWRIQSFVAVAMLTVVLGVVVAVTTLLGVDGFVAVALLATVLLGAIAWLVIVPEVRYRRWRWEVTTDEVRLQRGLIVVERTVIPMVRVQHVDTTQGPIMGAFDLSEVRVWTAAGAHAIPALAEKDAAQLRDRIALLARVTDDGGL